MGRKNRYPGLDSYMIQLVHTKAYQLSRQPGFSVSDKPDLEQELVLDACLQTKQYDPVRGKWEHFVSHIVKNKVADIIEERHAACRDPRREACSLDAPTGGPDDDQTSGEPEIFDLDGYLVRTGQNTRSEEDRRHIDQDIDHALHALSPRQRQMCLLLAADYPVTTIARELGLHRSTVYEAINHIREVFKQAGLEIYLRR